MKLYFKDESDTLRMVEAEGVDLNDVPVGDQQRWLKSFIHRNTGIRIKGAVLEVIG